MADIRMLPMLDGSVSPQLLDPAHYDAFTTAVSHLLSTSIARDTIAQLMDGLPLWSTLRGTRGAGNLQGSPLSQHEQLCAGSYELADELISSFDPNSLLFPAFVLQAFQNAEPGTKAFLFRLLELLARSIHCIAVSIELSGKQCHVGDVQQVIQYQSPPITIPGRTKVRTLPQIPPWPSLFFHHAYDFLEDYPFKVADVVGYWAEDRIFGGVVLFDRGDSGKEAHSMWLHSGRVKWTYRVWKPLDWQLQAMSVFLSTGSRADAEAEADKREGELRARQLRDMDKDYWKSIFPFFADIDNFERHDAYDAMAYHQIYRDSWERRIPAEEPPLTVRNTFDYPEYISLTDAVIYGPTPDTIPLPKDLSRPMRPKGASEKEAAVDPDRQGITTPLDASAAAGVPTGTTGKPLGTWDGREFHFADPDVDIDACIEEYFRKHQAKREHEAEVQGDE